MKLRYTAVVEFSEEDFKGWAIFEIEHQISDRVKTLIPFNIKPEGELKIATTDNARFAFNEKTNLVESIMGARGSQYFTGYWLDFLHAERAGIIPRQKAHIVCDDPECKHLRKRNIKAKRKAPSSSFPYPTDTATYIR